jgi:type IV secretion system protein VirB11
MPDIQKGAVSVIADRELEDEVVEMEKLSVANQRRLADLWRSFGDEGARWLQTDGVTDLSVGQGGQMLVGIGDKMVDAGYRLSQSDVLKVIKNAAKLGRSDNDDGHVSVDLPTGERFESMGPPTTTEWMFTVRKPNHEELTLETYRDRNQLSWEFYDLIRAGSEARANFLVVGAAFAGKTSLLKAIVRQPCFTSERCFFIEQTPEVPRLDKRWIMTKTKPIGRYSAGELVIKSLRHRVDRTFLGEMRGGETLDWLDTCNLGRSGGGGTIHAPSAQRGLRRVDQLVTKVTEAPQRDTIIETIDMIIVIRPHPDSSIGRRVSEVSKPVDYSDGKFQVEPYTI